MRIKGETLRVFRTTKGLKQAVVAQKLGISQQCYSKWEAMDTISTDCLERFVQATGSNYKELITVQKNFTPRKMRTAPNLCCSYFLFKDYTITIPAG